MANEVIKEFFKRYGYTEDKILEFLQYAKDDPNLVESLRKASQTIYPESGMLIPVEEHQKFTNEGLEAFEKKLKEYEIRSKVIPLPTIEEFCEYFGITIEEYKKIIEEARKNPEIIKRAFSAYLTKDTPDDMIPLHK